MIRVMAAGAALAALVGTSAPRAADAMPDLVGTWTGGGLGVGKQEGFADGPVTLVIAEQRERAFKGTKTHSEGEEAFFGAITAGGKGLLLADDGDGQTIGSILGPDQIELCYMEAGADVQVFCRTLTKQQ